MEYHKRLSISAFQDGSTYIVWITELDENRNPIGEQQEIDGVVADSEEEAINEEAINLVAEMILKRIKAQFPDSIVSVGPVTRE